MEFHAFTYEGTMALIQQDKKRHRNTSVQAVHRAQLPRNVLAPRPRGIAKVRQRRAQVLAPHRTAWPADVTLRQWACAARLSRPKLACAKRVWPVWCCRVGRICGGSGRRASSLGLEPWRWPRLRCAGVAHARLPESRAISYSAERRARVFVWYFR